MGRVPSPFQPLPWLLHPPKHAPLLQYEPWGAEVLVLRYGRHSHGGMPSSSPPVAGIKGLKILTGAVQSCLLLPPCPAATAAQLPPLLFVNH